MSNALNARQESFIEMMKRSDDHARHGFELLAKRTDAALYFDALHGAGLLDPSQNPGPAPVPDKPGFVHIPYWRALNYLQALARHAGETADMELADEVLSVIRAVSAAREPDGSVRDNYNTFWKFAEILGDLPLASLTDADIALVPTWLRSKYDHSMAGHALADGAIKRLLASDNPADIHRACILLDYCTAIEWDRGGRSEDLSTVVDDFWLHDMFAKHIITFGTKAGAESAQIFAERLRAVFTDKRRPYQSSLWRPAIETHPQNFDWRGAENCFVEGLRDVLLAWAATGSADTKTFVASLLKEDVDILRRIALHVIDERFDDFGDLLPPAINTDLFASLYHHELHRLLSRHFADAPDAVKTQIVDSIRALPLPETGEKRELHLKHIKREWLSAIYQKGSAQADALLVELNAAKDLGELSDHPDFLNYHETRVGPGPSPFTADILIAAAKDGSLLEKLGGFEERDYWRGPTAEGMWDTLQAAVERAPDVFLRQLNSYVKADVPVIHAVISGLRKGLETKADAKLTASQSRLWSKLLGYFEQVLAEPTFWEDEGPEPRRRVARRSRVLSAVADALASGTRVDKTAYPPRLLSLGWSILGTLLTRTPGMTEVADSDVMTQAINTPRGRAIEAFVNHALRVCRIETKKKKSHTEAWIELRTAFDQQLEMAKNANFEFSTLMARYIANLDYLSADWLEENITRVFDRDFPDNFRCALGGLPYATLTRRVYRLLADNGIVSAALDAKEGSDRENRRIVEFMGLALLWDEEGLDSNRFQKLFESGREDQLAVAADWFWAVRGDKLTQHQIATIRAFWSATLEWAKRQAAPPKRLLSHLARLAVYLPTLDAKSTLLLDAVAPFVGTDFAFQIFVEELSRLARDNPAEVSRILGLSLESNKPNYDLDNRLKELLRSLAAQGQRSAVLGYINQLMKSLPGMLEFYTEIAQTQVAG